MEDYEFNLERRLKKLSPDLSNRYRSTAAVAEEMLKKLSLVFPHFTDHSFLHSLNVVNYSNQVLQENYTCFNEAEIYIYLMAVALHDVGMAVGEDKFEEYVRLAGREDFVKEHPEMDINSVSRALHNDFSAVFVNKYGMVFDIPNEKYTYAIAEVARGHRKSDLFDEKQYPVDFEVEDGLKVNLPVLAALLRLTDEMDVANDRNPECLYDSADQSSFTHAEVLHFMKHCSIKELQYTDTEIKVMATAGEEDLNQMLVSVVEELDAKLKYCKSVFDKYAPFDFPFEDAKLYFI